ncbi:MAG: gamma carbonic anhydrase family protein [Cellvibrionaceae bacterium]|uniref:gamma carbonic anhydrase family protein n=1 Tax=uncultured Pseudoteredinibacter sp. TaxID=1641701 RepID=UPI002609E0C8|nr:gamma carbonic anhydrase family protein [uncultured Pseudoteredinibacter sp.]MCV6623623.1 gamma carbonic anhydrase family protein [Cellvibrionaceae bacterium]
MKYRLGDKAPELRGEKHFIADSADVIGDVILENNSSIWFNAVLRGDNDTITIGENSNVQDGAVLHTDPGVKLTLGKGVIVGHNVMLHGCEVGDNSLIGIGAVVLNRVVIGKNCIIGANALVTEGTVIPDNSMVLGSPAKVVKQIDDATAEFLKLNAQVYVDNLERFNEQLEPID